MTPRCYVDIETRASVNSLPVIGRVATVLHGILRGEPESLALAFPRLRKGEGRHPGNLVRVFAGSTETLDKVIHQLTENDSLKGHLRYGAPKLVPEDFKGPWIEYRRQRIPNLGSRLEKCREFRLREAEQLPFIRFVSKTNMQGFSLHINATPGERTQDCKPDSYGLSVATRPFALPLIE